MPNSNICCSHLEGEGREDDGEGAGEGEGRALKLEVTQEKIDEAMKWARSVVSGERRSKKEVERLAILLFCIEGEHDKDSTNGN